MVLALVPLVLGLGMFIEVAKQLAVFASDKVSLGIQMMQTMLIISLVMVDLPSG